ncbi:MAG: protein-L-isoaspartate(D-aspartate) O-methyltransferase [Bacteroidales bacterium]|nr:protein-L-isoaspartate(D-aspartate) O-methyltransferase [Bacteroidales bacterium]MDZ4203894.1 protein-L-isoaspartate(D-aspartate) O-methyltransferase [Bacteroidales bacterium]
MEDNYRHQGLRKKLIENIRHKGINNQAVLQAMEMVPRHFFFDSSFLEFAYDDKPFPIGAAQTISQPYTVAYQTLLLDVHKGDKILEVGTGSGYQACILAQMGAKVFTIERHKSLYQKAKTFLPTIGFGQIKVFYGDGFKGLPAFAPYDKILVTAAAPYVPVPLIEQLKTGGLLVLPLDEGDAQRMTVVRKLPEGELQMKEHGAFRFVPLLPDKSNE